MKEYKPDFCIKSFLTKKNKTNDWFPNQMGRNNGAVSRSLTIKVHPSVEPLVYCRFPEQGLSQTALHLNLDVKELLASSKDVQKSSHNLNSISCRQ